MKRTYIYSILGSLFLAMVIFFMVTTDKAEPVVLDLPQAKEETPALSSIQESDSTVTILLLKNNMIYCYPGSYKNHGKKLPLTSANEFLEREAKQGNNPFVLIKTSPEAGYKNTVDLLDQMTIHNIKNYKLLPLSSMDKEFIQTIAL